MEQTSFPVSAKDYLALIEACSSWVADQGWRKGVQVGPNAVIGSDCVLDRRCSVANSLVFPGSYIGEALELADVIVDRNRLINVRVGAAVPVVDKFILGSISDRHLRPWLGKLFSRGLAVGLPACTWPVLLLAAVGLKMRRSKSILHTTEVVRLPTASDEVTWRTFRLWSFCPHSRLLY